MSSFTDFWLTLERHLFQRELDALSKVQADNERIYHRDRAWEMRGRLLRIDPEFREMLDKKKRQLERRKEDNIRLFKKEIDQKIRDYTTNAKKTKADAKRKAEATRLTAEITTTKPPAYIR